MVTHIMLVAGLWAGQCGVGGADGTTEYLDAGVEYNVLGGMYMNMIIQEHA